MFGEKAQKAPSGSVAGTPAATNSRAHDGESLPGLKISWHVSPPQNVAIIDLSGKAGGYEFSPIGLHET